MQTRTVSKARKSTVVAGTALLVILYLLNGLFGFAHLNNLKVIYPDGSTIIEPGHGPSLLNIVYAVTHLVGAALLIAGAALVLKKEQVKKARSVYIVAALCGFFPSPMVGLAGLLFGAVVTGTWGRSRPRPK
ncbi:hypothetical protein ACWDOR_44350 [Streptosporangium canum]|uniref:hypothetical protein n=1 Tax=Streptosporangium canum TaxID=324952 RepID=UPI0036BC3543